MSAKQKVTTDVFTIAKAMLKGNETQENVAKLLCISTETVRRIRNANAYEDYQAYVQSVHAKPAEKKESSAEKVVEKTAPTSHVSSYQINRLIEQQNETIELLKVISNKLVFIVEQLA